ncbi:arginine--tRNA ligase [Atribacter laminatus]|jgi:arginyl-tRNA synthetase|uniref:Arginine--tRNA ligase n=1 Tax=Atribacter laminatus TaxID=2847778 RepID=A0A7T1F3G0_ATRLM|nr:arginine--tRNA ligase [Atribacter laminatus]QPM68837.1 Arginine--tRNA ligase [Atribacter laminatus]
MSRLITDVIKENLQKVVNEQYGNFSEGMLFTVEPTRDKAHGDFASNIAFLLSKKARKSPREIANHIVSLLNKSLNHIATIEIAGGGFINFFLNDQIIYSFMKDIYQEKDEYGSVQIGNNEKFQVEFVSVNPTGPLHVGHGKCAAFGDALARVLKKAGFSVEKEYYINDAGKQIDLLGLTLEFRYRQLFGEKIEIPEGGYKGDYMIDIAQDLKKEKGDTLLSLSNEEKTGIFKSYAVSKILQSIQKDLSDFQVYFDVWFSEKTLYQNHEVEKALNQLIKQGFTYEKDGALWLKTQQWGDDKDRVLVRENGSPTYFASDIAYHFNKWQRGFERVIDIWGADHHGYIPRMKAAVNALGLKKDFLEIFIVQFVTLLRNGQPERMSTRQGEFVPLRNLIDEVGVDVARYYFLMRDPATHLEFDIEQAKKTSMDNPVYYVQYAYARISSVFREMEKKNLSNTDIDRKYESFQNEQEKLLAKNLIYFPEVVKRSALARQPYMICNYVTDLAGSFHTFYNNNRILDEDNLELTAFRLNLCRATRQVLKNALDLLGISAPETM